MIDLTSGGLGVSCRWLRVVAMACLVLLAPGLVMAQGASGSADRVGLEVVRFGPGGVSRGGEWTGVLVRVDDRASEPRDLILRVKGADPDGDTPVYDRVLASNPGTPQDFWLYFPIERGFGPRDSVAIEAYAVGGERAGAEGVLYFVPGAREGRTVATPQRLAAPMEPVIGVFGSWHLGLGGADGYEQPSKSATDPVSLTGHAQTRVVTGLGHGDIPDQAWGLSVFDALVWGGATPNADPLRLSLEQAEAIEGWVRGGGRLVVVLPAVGQEWLTPANRLAKLLPAVRPGELTRRPIGEWESLLARPGDELPDGATVGVRGLRPVEGTPRADRRVILRGPASDGGEDAAVVVKRALGAGSVTLIGLDLGAPSLAGMRLPRADSFWHRVLGRRGELDPTSRVAQDATAQRRELLFDSDLQGEIATSRRASVVVLLGFLVFTMYWLVSGPVGYALLSKAGLKRHAWVAFVGSIAVFTVIAWLGARALRPVRVGVTHITFLQTVAGQPGVRAETWASVLVPWYGDVELSIGSDESGESGQGLISAWTPPSDGLIGSASFPDNRVYRVDARRPDRIRVPARSTVKQVHARWNGPSGWEGTISAVRDPGFAPGEEIRIDAAGVATGSITHDLPGALEDVTVLVVRRQRPVSGELGARSPVIGDAYSITGVWAPGAVIDLNTVTDVRPGERSQLEPYTEALLEDGQPSFEDVRRSVAGRVSERLTALTLFSQMAPPDFTRAGTDDALALRDEAHGVDLRDWFTQPCLIVVGHLKSASSDELPVPLLVDGRPAPATGGRTVVSWVYPLAENPPSPVPAGESPAQEPGLADD